MDNKSRKTRILFYGDAPTVATGFGTVSRNILGPLINSGSYEVTILGINHWGSPHSFPAPIWPVGINKDQDPYGRKLVCDRIAESEFDILFMIQDSFILEFIKDLIPALKTGPRKFKSIVYFPVDGTPKSSWVEAMEVADYPVTYTKFGFEECVKAYNPIGRKLKVIPHGVNSNDFYPLTHREIFEFRKKFFGPFSDHVIVTNVNRNQPRKDIPRTIAAFKEFKKHHEKALLYLHMARVDQGWNLPEVVKAFGLSEQKDVAFPNNFGPNQGYPLQVLNQIYNASDMVVSSTIGEGWGLSCTEAMATKTPVVFPENTSLKEIIGEDRGVLVKSGHDIDHFTVLPHDNEVVRPLVSVKDMADKMHSLYKDEVKYMEIAEAAYEWVTENLNWEKNVVPKWKALIDEAAAALHTDKTTKELRNVVEI